MQGAPHTDGLLLQKIRGAEAPRVFIDQKLKVARNRTPRGA
jgi:hypothetical protein